MLLNSYTKFKKGKICTSVVRNPEVGMEHHFLMEGEFCSEPLAAVANGGKKYMDKYEEGRVSVQDRWANMIKR